MTYTQNSGVPDYTGSLILANVLILMSLAVLIYTYRVPFQDGIHRGLVTIGAAVLVCIRWWYALRSDRDAKRRRVTGQHYVARGEHERVRGQR